MHGELATLGLKVAPSTVWEILQQEGIDPAPERTSTTWADFLRSQAGALLACDFIETVTLSGQLQYILAVIEHASRRVRVLGTTANPTAVWVTQAMKNLVMDLEDAGCRARFLIRDRDGKFPARMDEILAEVGIQTVLTGIRMPRMNSIMERWVQTCCRELLDRCLLWNEHHLRHALAEYERFYNEHRAHQALDQAAPLRAVPDPITEPARVTVLDVRRRDRLGGMLGRSRLSEAARETRNPRSNGVLSGRAPGARTRNLRIKSRQIQYPVVSIRLSMYRSSRQCRP
ncbi:integrase core domain-containing protein [Nonomuraea soli]|uniref:integrase core domain-containing protein n=1 Tax=Nonomuraea soli TaxID=1032476 RepID=UPI001C66A9DC|nr:integrase core domain-containing protein [Nonomuraea soli]